MARRKDEDEERAEDLVRTKSIATRKPLGGSMIDRLMYRKERRPAGNSRKFWRKVEVDDPFREPAKKKEERRAVYASGRFVRVDDGKPRPTPPPQQPRPKPQREARPEPRPEPPREARRPAPPPEPRRPPPPPPQEEPVYTPDRRTAPSPLPEPEPAMDRRPPMPSRGPKKGGGRMNVGPSRRRGKVVQGGAPPGGYVPRVSNVAPGAPPVYNESPETSQPPPRPNRRRKERSFGKEPKAPPPMRGLDSVLGILGELQQAEKLYNETQEAKAKGLAPPPGSEGGYYDRADPPPRPKPRQPAPQARRHEPVPDISPERNLGDRRDAKPAPGPKGLDHYLSMLGELGQAERLHNEQQDMKKQGVVPEGSGGGYYDTGSDDGWRPPPKPKRYVDGPSSRPAPTPPPTPAPAPPQGNAVPPRQGNAAVRKRMAPPEPEQAKPSNPARPRKPPGMGGGALDDIFGGGGGDRVRIGRRTKTKK